MEKAASFPVRPVMFVAGDDDARKPAVLALIEKLGFAAIDAGPLRIARLLEAYGMLWIEQALERVAGPEIHVAFHASHAKERTGRSRGGGIRVPPGIAERRQDRVKRLASEAWSADG